jgi:hypothetical protein
MMQFLAKVDLEYTHLVNLNQWKINDPNSTIAALQAEISDLKIALQATKLPPSSRQPKQKPTWTPKEGQPMEVVHNNKKWKYWGRCKHWNQTHTTLEHKSIADLPTQPAPGNHNGGPSANLATGTQSAPTGGPSTDSSAQYPQPLTSDSSVILFNVGFLVS